MKLIFRPLGDLCDSTIELADPKKDPDRGFLYIDISAVDNTSKKIVSPHSTTGKIASVRARQIVRENDVIVSTTRPNLNAVAKVPRELDCQICSTGFCVLRAGPDLDPEYLFAFVQSQSFINSLSNLVQGALYPAITNKQVFSQRIPWVPINYQRCIAIRLKAQLVEVEKARKAAEAQWNTISAVKFSLLDAFFDFTQYGPVRIGKHAKLQSGFAFKSKAFEKSGIKLLRNANVSPGKIIWTDVIYLSEGQEHLFDIYKLKLGDVIISLDRPLISSGIKVAKIGEKDIPSLLVQRVGRFILDEGKILPDYLYGFMKTNHFKRAISGHDQSLGVPHISPTQVEFVEIPLPDYTIQKEIANKINEITKVESEIEMAILSIIADLDALSKRILSQAFEMN